MVLRVSEDGLGGLLKSSECSWGPLRIPLDPLGTVLGAHNHSARPTHRDFGASWEHLVALLAPSLTLSVQDVFAILLEPVEVDFELSRLTFGASGGSHRELRGPLGALLETLRPNVKARMSNSVKGSAGAPKGLQLDKHKKRIFNT